MTRERQARDGRRRGIQVVLSPRDKQVLRALARFRIARTSDLVRVAFSGIRADTAARRLRRLFDASYIDVRVGGRAEENMITLGATGRAWLATQGEAVGGIPRGGLAHHLAIVRQWSAIVSAVKTDPRLVLEVVQADWEIREQATGANLVPDALIQLGVKGRGAIRLALEVDLGTESLRTLRAKVAAYEEFRTLGHGLFGWQDHGLAVALPSATVVREKAVQRILEDIWSGWWVTWQDEAGLRRAIHALTAAVHPPLTDSPYGKGRVTTVTPCASGRPQAEKTGP